MTDQAFNILIVHTSGRNDGSVSRQLSKELIEQFDIAGRTLNIVERDLAHGVPFIDQDWIDANYTPADKRTADQTATLSYSDGLVDELKTADLVVIGAPIYNFSVPAVLKAWIDLIARVSVTFTYNENGPVGLLENKSAVVVAASGGTPFGSDIDFATGYMRHVLGFVGITDVAILGADRLAVDADASLAKAKAEISEFAASFSQKFRQAA